RRGTAPRRQALGDLVVPEVVDAAEDGLQGQQREGGGHGESPAAWKRPVWKNISPNSACRTRIVKRNQPCCSLMCSTWVTPGESRSGRGSRRRARSPGRATSKK